MEPKSGYTLTLMLQLIGQAEFAAHADWRLRSCLELWVLASLEPKNEAQMCAMTEQHFSRPWFKRENMMTFMCPTLVTRDGFETETMSERSLAKASQMLSLCLFERNTCPLGTCYNEVVEVAAANDAHPMALLDGVFLAARATRLKQFDVRFDVSLGYLFTI